MKVYVEQWAPEYGSPYELDVEESAQDAEIVEDNSLEMHVCEGEIDRLAFVDGVRRIESRLYCIDRGIDARGITGSFACGSVIWDGSACVYGPHLVEHVVIWGSGIAQAIPPAPGGWAWSVRSIASADPDAPAVHIQEQMLREEVSLAETIANSGIVTIRDGPLMYYHPKTQIPLVGYVKTHHRALLGADNHARVPQLRPGERTSVFAFGERFGCYARLAASLPFGGPWSGIVRLEVAQAIGRDAATSLLSQVGFVLQRFAGVAYRDPRAPQNLQPVFALESRLRHLCGSADLAVRAIRRAVLSLGGVA